jgi:hypothetical protein
MLSSAKGRSYLKFCEPLFREFADNVTEFRQDEFFHR